VLSFRASLALVLSTAIVTLPALANRPHRNTSSTSHSRSLTATHATRASSNVHSRKGHTKQRGHILHGQQSIEPARVTEIQQALIREHYMSGDATGEWDSSTQAAMQKYQADQGWQTKLMPDSRAIKKLGLGPDYSTAINAKTASFGTPPPISTIPASQAAGFAAAAHTDR